MLERDRVRSFQKYAIKFRTNSSGDFCTNHLNAQAPSLFSNETSRRTKLMVCETVSGNSALLQSNMRQPHIWLKKGTIAWNCFTGHQLRASACFVGEEGGSLCIVCALKIDLKLNGKTKYTNPGNFREQLIFVLFANSWSLWELAN